MTFVEAKNKKENYIGKVDENHKLFVVPNKQEDFIEYLGAFVREMAANDELALSYCTDGKYGVAQIGITPMGVSYEFI